MAVMAHAALISELGHQLFESITSNSEAHNTNESTTRDKILQGLKDHRASRTNQFEVSAKYAGLIEKFEIFNRDDLAMALQSRLSRLENVSGESRWTPEFLSFLLQLSDRPLERTKPDDIGSSSDANDVSSSAWKQILAEGAEDDPGLWDDIERGYHSSGDEGQAEDSDSEHTTSTQATSVREDSIEAIARSSLVLPDKEGLDVIRETQNPPVGDTRLRKDRELEIIRQTLSMLQGLPSQLYRTDQKTSRVALTHDVSIATASSMVLNDLLRQCAIIGTNVNALRTWASSPQSLAYLRACQASIQLKLKHFNLGLADIDQKYCAASHETSVVSIIATRSWIEQLAAPLLCLSALLRRTTHPKIANSFALLDELYNEICITQIIGNSANLSVLVDVFAAGLKAYLRPIGTWIREGVLDDRDNTLFVEHRHSSGTGTTGSLWHEHFALRRSAHGEVLAPAFMQSLASRIFAMGKSRAFLQALDTSNEALDSPRPFDLPALHSDALTPFSQILTQALTNWIDAISSDCTQTLRIKVLHDFGLLRMQRELERVFCTSNGTALQNFADTLFWQVDHDSERWQNSFLLSELAMSTLLSDNTGSFASLSVAFDPNPSAASAKSALSPIRALSTLKLSYIYPWVLQNITKSETAGSHTKILVFLLQIYRAQSTLRNSFMDHRHFQSSMNALNGAIQTALKLHHDLLWLADLLYAHIAQTASVLGRAVRKGLEDAADIDAMADTWADYERRLESSTIVAKNLSPIREAIIGILEMSLRWSREWSRLVDDCAQHSSRIKLTDDDEEEKESPEQRDDMVGAPNRTQRSAHDSIVKMQSNFDENLSFIAAGLRGISRAGGDPAVEALAERLGWRTR